MRYAVFADIHGNLEALHAALEYTQKQKLSRYLVLGDSIGYGANPNECFQWSLDHAQGHILGNHEAAIIHETIRRGFTDWAREAIEWTAEKLLPRFLPEIKKLPYLQIYGSNEIKQSESLQAAKTAKQSCFERERLPRRPASGGTPRKDVSKASDFDDVPAQQLFTLAHGTLHAPERFEYLFDLNAAHKSFMALQTPVGFVGHSHVPCFFSEKEQNAGHLKEGAFRLQKGERYIFNPGSIGQPRDQDPRLSFGIFDPDELTFEIVRLPYDNKTAAAKILKEGLPRFLADRLL